VSIVAATVRNEVPFVDHFHWNSEYFCKQTNYAGSCWKINGEIIYTFFKIMKINFSYLQNTLNDCKLAESANDFDVMALMMKKLPETHNGRCMLACILERLDVFIFEGRTFHYNTLLDMMQTFTKISDELIEIMGKVGEKCREMVINDNDRCETAAKGKI
jgi:hypothetical protein